MYINTFKYTPKDVSCQLCTEYVKKLGCTALRCPWLVNLRFLDAALNQLELRPVTFSSFLTDGEHLCYRPEWVLRTFQTAKEIPVRD